MFANILARLRDANFLAALICPLMLAVAAVYGAPVTLAIGAALVAVVVFFAPVLEIEVKAALDASEAAALAAEMEAAGTAARFAGLLKAALTRADAPEPDAPVVDAPAADPAPAAPDAPPVS